MTLFSLDGLTRALPCSMEITQSTDTGEKEATVKKMLNQSWKEM